MIDQREQLDLELGRKVKLVVCDAAIVCAYVCCIGIVKEKKAHPTSSFQLIYRDIHI